MPAKVWFWLAAGTVIYTYAGYPLLLLALRVFFARPVRKAPIQPSVSIVIPAFNEAAVIAAKVESALRLQYPAERLEIVVVSDGSTDGTEERARAAAAAGGAGDRVRVIAHSTNRGKVAVLNETVPLLAGEIVVFTDAAAMFEPDAIAKLVRCYADPQVGAVSGVYRVRTPESAAIGPQEDIYWKYETFLKLQEASMGSVIGAHGNLHSVRRALYPYPPADTINDDLVIALKVLQQGYRVAYEPEAIASEEAHEMSGFGRRVRIVAGNLRELGEIRRFVRPLRPIELFYFISHKVLRIVVPFAMTVALVSTVALVDQPLYRAFFWVQIAVYAVAALGALVTLRPAVLRLPYYFCMVNLAVFVALYRIVAGRGRVAWE